MAAFFASCNDEETGKENKWFFAPEAGVSGTTVEVSCRTKFGDGVLSSAQAGFAYAPIDNTGSFTETTDVTVDGQVMSCRLTGLDAETSYLIYAFVDMGSGGRMQSKPVVVKTGVDPVLPDDPRFGVPECSQVTASSATVGRQRGIRGLFPLRDGDVGRRAARGGHDRTRRQERHAHGPERFDEV